MAKSKLSSLFSLKTLVYLGFVSVITQFVIAVAYLPFYLYGLVRLVVDGEILQYFDPYSLLAFVIASLIFFFFIFLFKKFTLDTKLISEKLLIFLIILIINCLVHLTAFINMFFPYFITFISILAWLQTLTVIHARNKTIFPDSYSWVSMIIAIIGGFIIVTRFFPFIWFGETILKLTNHQFNLFWFDYSGSAFIYLSICTSIIYFSSNYILNLISKR